MPYSMCTSSWWRSIPIASANRATRSTSATSWVASTDPVVEVECAIGVRTALHVDPQKAIGAGRGIGEPVEVGKSRVGIDVETDLGWLDRDLWLQAGLGRGLQHQLVVLDRSGGFRHRLDVLAELGEDGADALGLERDRRFERRVEVLARHEPPHRTLDKAPLRHVLGEPRVLCAPQQQRPHPWAMILGSTRR